MLGKALVTINDCYRTQRRPFLNTAKAEPFSELGYLNLQDQIGAFLGGASDVLEHKFNSLSVQGRQSIATYWRKDLIELGDQMRRGKPNDIRKLLENKLMAEIDGEEQGKLMRFALEASRLEEFLKGAPANKALSISTEQPPADLLKRAMTALGTPRDKYNTILMNGKPVGVISTEPSGTYIKISAIYSDQQRMGYASDAIRLAVGNKPSWSFVEPSNSASMKMFESLGYVKDSQRTIDGTLYNVMIREPLDTHSSANLKRLKDYQISMALEQDASSSGAQIIALTTKNKQLADLSNVIPTMQKQRLNNLTF